MLAVIEVRLITTKRGKQEYCNEREGKGGPNSMYECINRPIAQASKARKERT